MKDNGIHCTEKLKMSTLKSTLFSSFLLFAIFHNLKPILLCIFTFMLLCALFSVAPISIVACCWIVNKRAFKAAISASLHAPLLLPLCYNLLYFLIEKLACCPISMYPAWVSVYPVLYFLYFLVGLSVKICAFGYFPTYHFICHFICTTFPAAVRVTIIQLRPSPLSQC